MSSRSHFRFYHHPLIFAFIISPFALSGFTEAAQSHSPFPIFTSKRGAALGKSPPPPPLTKSFSRVRSSSSMGSGAASPAPTYPLHPRSSTDGSSSPQGHLIGSAASSSMQITPSPVGLLPGALERNRVRQYMQENDLEETVEQPTSGHGNVFFAKRKNPGPGESKDFVIKHSPAPGELDVAKALNAMNFGPKVIDYDSRRNLLVLEKLKSPTITLADLMEAAAKHSDLVNEKGDPTLWPGMLDDPGFVFSSLPIILKSWNPPEERRVIKDTVSRMYQEASIAHQKLRERGFARGLEDGNAENFFLDEDMRLKVIDQGGLPEPLHKKMFSATPEWRGDFLQTELSQPRTGRSRSIASPSLPTLAGSPRSQSQLLLKLVRENSKVGR